MSGKLASITGAVRSVHTYVKMCVADLPIKSELTNPFNIEPTGPPTHLPFQMVRRYILAQRLLVWPTPTTFLAPCVNLTFVQVTPSQEEQRLSCTPIVNSYLLIYPHFVIVTGLGPLTLSKAITVQSRSNSHCLSDTNAALMYGIYSGTRFGRSSKVRFLPFVLVQLQTAEIPDTVRISLYLLR
jgi:hypothetical protein